MIIDGAMGTMIQGYNFSEEDYRGRLRLYGDFQRRRFHGRSGQRYPRGGCVCLGGEHIHVHGRALRRERQCE